MQVLRNVSHRQGWGTTADDLDHDISDLSEGAPSVRKCLGPKVQPYPEHHVFEYLQDVEE